MATVCNLFGTNDVGRSWAFGRLLDIEIDLLALCKILAADIFHVEEYIVVRIVSRNETVAACVVEEINFTVCHCKQTYGPFRDKTSLSRDTTTVDSPRQSSSTANTPSLFVPLADFR